MLRTILMLCPVLAFALPLVAAGPSQARPLSLPGQPAEWCWGGGDCGDFGDDLLLAVCVQTQIFVQTGDDDRAYECDTLTGPACLASCAGEGGDVCRSQCDGDGALFCAPSELKTRWGGWNDDDDDDDHDNDQDNLVFINTQTCLELNLNDL